MIQKEVINQYNNLLERELINLFHKLDLPLHFNKTGTKTFTNYQRVAIIFLYYRSKKTLRDFVEEINESKWMNWLGLKKAPRKSTLHDWLKIFGMKVLRKMNSFLKPKHIELAAIDGSGLDSWQRSRHYSRRIGEPPMPYAKIDVFIDVKKQIILDFQLVMRKEHDAKSATKIFKRNNLKGIDILGDGAYDSEPLHEIARNKKGALYAPVRKKNKRSDKKRPKGRYRRLCLELPEFQGQRSIVEAVIKVLKKKQIPYLRSKKEFMKQREFAWNIILYNIRRKTKISEPSEIQTFIFCLIVISQFRTEPEID